MAAVFLAKSGVKSGASKKKRSAARRRGAKPSTAPPRRLVVVRHGKSSWKEPALADKARPLAPRGTRAVPELAGLIESAGEGWVPRSVVTSDAARALATTDLLAAALAGKKGPPAVVEDPGLYDAAMTGDGARVAASLARAMEGEGVTVAAAVGHNPGFEALVEELCGEGVTLKTANAALLEEAGPTAAGTWPDALRAPGGWRLKAVARAPGKQAEASFEDEAPWGAEEAAPTAEEPQEAAGEEAAPAQAEAAPVPAPRRRQQGRLGPEAPGVAIAALVPSTPTQVGSALAALTLAATAGIELTVESAAAAAAVLSVLERRGQPGSSAAKSR